MTSRALKRVRQGSYRPDATDSRKETILALSSVDESPPYGFMAWGSGQLTGNVRSKSDLLCKRQEHARYKRVPMR
jgi:predicted nicotinamide N-methyase